jgi:hypothetical protein
VKFAQAPEDIECALTLDDTVIWGGLSLMVNSGDEWISKFAERMRDRKLYKCLDVRAIKMIALPLLRRPIPCAPVFATR